MAPKNALTSFFLIYPALLVGAHVGCYSLKSVPTFAVTAASILMSGGQERLKPSPGVFFVASMPSLLPMAISLVAWPSTSDWAFGEDAVALIFITRRRSLPRRNSFREMADGSRAAGLPVEMQVLGAARQMSPATELTLDGAGQEGLTNVRKHAGTSNARLTLDFSETAKVRLSVSDNGAGAIAGSETKGGFGLLGLRERAHLLGGEVRVKTTPGAGFTLEVEVPA